MYVLLVNANPMGCSKNIDKIKTEADDTIKRYVDNLNVEDLKINTFDRTWTITRDRSNLAIVEIIEIPEI